MEVEQPTQEGLQAEEAPQAEQAKVAGEEDDGAKQHISLETQEKMTDLVRESTILYDQADPFWLNQSK